MQLLALDGRERYHTLASLVENGAEELKDHLFIGFDPVDNHIKVSRALHEITHVASFRATRLGFWIARVATPLFLAQTGQTLDIPDDVQALLGMFAPLLEGLAIYGQLDYDADNTEAVLPFPLNKITTNNAAASFHGGPLAALRRAKVMAISDGLLTELLVRKSSETAHYLIGYLYVKAVAAQIARFAPRLAVSSTLLPLLIRIICDHPVIEQAVGGNLTAQDAIEAIHASLRGITHAHVEMIDRMLNIEKVRANFDNWDIHAQLKGNKTQPIFHSQHNPLFLQNEYFDDLDKEYNIRLKYLALRMSTTVHLTNWTSGTLIEVVDEGKQVRLRLADGVSKLHARDAVLVLYSRLKTVNSGLNEAVRAKLKELDEKILVHARHAAAVGSRITVGNYLTLTKGNHGTAFWVDGSIKEVVPFSLLENQLDAEEFKIAVAGLLIAPDHRLAVAQGLHISDVQNAARGRTNGFLLESLISSPEHQMVARSNRLNAFLTPALRTVLTDWCARPHAYPDGRLDGRIVDRLSVVFDRPHFGGGSFNDLLPDLSTITNLQPGAMNVEK